jgi:hypothetical protein
VDGARMEKRRARRKAERGRKGEKKRNHEK